MAGRSEARRNQLVESHLDLVGPIARLVARRVPVSIELADLEQAGMLGLIQAAAGYTPGRAPFRLYAKTRIRGAILDSLRRRNWIHSQQVGIEGDILDAAPLADELVMRAEVADQVRVAVDGLPPREARIIERHVMDCEPLRRAAEDLRISQARASQLKARGLRRLRKSLPGPA